MAGGVTQVQQFLRLGKAALLQAGEKWCAIKENGEFAFLWPGGNLDAGLGQGVLQFGGETRRARFVASGGAIDDLKLHDWISLAGCSWVAAGGSAAGCD